MKRIIKRVKATNATLAVGLGFKPTMVRILNEVDRTELVLCPSQTAQMPYGMTVAAAGDKADAASAAAGCVLYDGDGVQATATTAKLVDADGDYKDDITTWTTDTAGNKTGHFDNGMTITDINVGSKVHFGDGTIATITSITNDGDATDEVTLDVLPVSNEVSKITYMWDMKGAAAGQSVPAGIQIGASATVNDTDGDALLIIADLCD